MWRFTISLLWWAVFVSPVWPQSDLTIANAWPQDGLATTRPVSERLVRLEILHEGSGPATLYVQEGALARVGVGDREFGLASLVRGGGAEVSLFSIQKVGEGLEKLRIIEVLKVSIGEVATSGAIPFSVSVLGEHTPEQRPPEPDGPCVRCCVFCGDLWACACAVELDCGSCCCGVCCGLG
jgi:hypothetical protein